MLKREQRTFIEDRLTALRRQKYRQAEAVKFPEPPDVRSAQQLVRRWSTKRRAAVARLYAKVDAASQAVRKELLFGTEQSALAALRRFAALKVTLHG